MRSWTKLAVVLALSLMARLPHAQQQTPENAQKFIAQIAALGQISYAWHSEGDTYEQGFYRDASVDYPGDQPPKRYFSKLQAPIWDVRASQRCATSFRYKHTAAKWVETRYEILTQDTDSMIAWRDITSLQVAGPTVVLRGGPRYERFSLPTPEMAKRVGYAMEVLRVSCDATQGTGF